MNNVHSWRLLSGRKRVRLSHEDYTVACICPLAVELTPLRAILDEVHEDLPSNRDHNAYILGQLESHNVVIAVLPSIGNNDSGVAAARLVDDFPNIRFALLVGVGAGVPGRDGKDDIRLGDVVVSEASGTNGGVVQFDRGKLLMNGSFKLVGHLNKPSALLSATVKKLRAQYQQGEHRIQEFVADILHRNPNMKQEYSRPPANTDVLFATTYEHVGGDTCQGCDVTKIMDRSTRGNSTSYVHYGTIGSSNTLMRDALKRDSLRDDYGIICIEMEAAALMDHLPCLVIRGICDYADSHKNKRWQPYAAAAAAAYAKEYLRAVPPETSAKRSILKTQVEDRTIMQQSPDESSASSSIKVLLESLAFDRMEARLRNVSDAMPQTCKWLLSHQEFVSWEDKDKVEEHNGFLWIKGKPGSGKSTIMKELLKREKRDHPEQTVISYFFNARAPSELEKSSLGLYRSLVYQLLLAAPFLQSSFVEQYLWKEKDQLVDDWTVNELQSFLNYAVEESSPPPITILIDALDEGDDNDIRQLVAFLGDLGYRAQSAGIFLKTCLSSRHYPHISTDAGLSLVLEDQQGHVDDIVKYVERKLVGDRTQRMQEFRDQVCRKSANIFLWVVLVVPILNKVYDNGGAVEDMTCHLEELPAELDGLFVNILRQSSSRIEECITLLQWVLFSFRSLSPAALSTATKISLDQDDDDDKMEENLNGRTYDQVKLYLLSTSRGLVEMTKSQPPTVQFIHETIRDFLRCGGLAQIDTSLATGLIAKSHDRLKRGCFTYLKRHAATIPHSTFNMDKEKIKTFRDEVDSRFSFLRYAATHIFQHADAAEAHGESQRGFVSVWQDPSKDFLVHWINIRNVFQIHRSQRYTLKAPLLYILSDQGLGSLVKMLADPSCVNEVSKERFGSALQAACVVGSEATVTGLIQAGSTVDLKAGEHKYPLFAAIRRKNDRLIQLLISYGAKPSGRNMTKLLEWTVFQNYLSGFKVLVELGTPINIDDGGDPKHNALNSAIANGNTTMVSILLKEADFSSLPNSIGEALLVASRYDKPQIVEILIRYGRSTLHLRRTQINANVLIEASRRGYLQIVNLLLEYGAEVNKEIMSFLMQRTALVAASEGGQVDVVKLLIEHGAEIDKELQLSAVPTTALIAASGAGHVNVAKLLIEHGAEVDKELMPGSEYRTALIAAAASGRLEVVELLTKHGADVNHVVNPNFGVGTALLAAALCGRLRVVEFLIENGADVNWRCNQDYTALRYARKYRYGDVEELLLRHGAIV